jgi:hypothetical protein
MTADDEGDKKAKAQIRKDVEGAMDNLVGK